jgi:hypothetical protein
MVAGVRPHVALLLSCLLLAGCLGGDGDDDGPTGRPAPTGSPPGAPPVAPPSPGNGTDLEFFREDVTVTSAQSGSLQATVPEGAADVRLHVLAGSSPYSGLRVVLDGCGEYVSGDGAATGTQEAHLLCAVPSPGPQELRVSVEAGMFQGQLALVARMSSA